MRETLCRIRGASLNRQEFNIIMSQWKEIEQTLKWTICVTPPTCEVPAFDYESDEQPKYFQNIIADVFKRFIKKNKL